MNNGFTIFLSGGMNGLSLKEQTEWRKAVKSKLYDKGDYFRRLKVFSPPDYYSPVYADYNSEHEAMEFDLYNLRKSDLVVVNFNAPKSIGTAMELMLAKEYRIPVLGLNEDNVEIHSWLSECTLRMFNDIDELVDYIINFYLR